MSKKHDVEAAKAAADFAAKVLKANEILWADAWSAAPNPFVAIKNYRSPAQRAKRKPIIDNWLAATAAYQAIKPRSAV